MNLLSFRSAPPIRLRVARRGWTRPRHHAMAELALAVAAVAARAEAAQDAPFATHAGTLRLQPRHLGPEAAHWGELGQGAGPEVLGDVQERSVG
eukprot:CAMPEP_0179320688 /NCGR_PEP_ID=MMETSP0797-20121207/58187_1 /TAXON_ID=47934 /ORGANISM="Dinophysis acuminata, Strain DAEP01" /LENGTH=93 /DNA_ID=CAMNT_0021032213 /DNA_START=269 /DNA_END=546 /DNA_ORIENTATION=-